MTISSFNWLSSVNNTNPVSTTNSAYFNDIRKVSDFNRVQSAAGAVWGEYGHKFEQARPGIKNYSISELPGSEDGGCSSGSFMNGVEIKISPDLDFVQSCNQLNEAHQLQDRTRKKLIESAP